MIKPLDVVSAMSKPATLNPTFCAAPTVYENTASYQPAGQKLNLNCCGGKGSRHLGQKLNLVV